MTDQSELPKCPRCGASISSDAPQRLCPQCLLAQVALPTEPAHRTKGALPTQEELRTAFPQLEILEMIGQGGMGFVFKARQPKLDRLVALKILPKSLAADPAFAERFTREGRVLARLNHPNIVTVHDFGEAHGFFYLLMEFVDGVNLRQAMKVGRFTPDQSLAIVPKICDALQFAHHEGILHRDIKPENILLDAKGRVKIADFGIAKIIGSDQLETASATHDQNVTGVIGTPQYMAPEQVENPRTVDQRVDVYSLGVVFYEMLTGELPLGRFAPPSQKSAADPRLDQVVLRALEKEPARRTQTASEVKTQVETIAQTPPNNPGPTPSPAKVQSRAPWPVALRHGALAATLVLLLFLLGTSVITALSPRLYMALARVAISTNGNTYNPFHIQREAERAKSEKTLRTVSSELGLASAWADKYYSQADLDQTTVLHLLRQQLEVRQSRDTALLEIRFYSESPAESAQVANKIAEVYCSLSTGNRPTIIDRAQVPTRPVRPNLPLNIAFALAIALPVAALVGLVAALRYRKFHASKTSDTSRASTIFLPPAWAMVLLAAITATAIFFASRRNSQLGGIELRHRRVSTQRNMIDTPSIPSQTTPAPDTAISDSALQEITRLKLVHANQQIEEARAKVAVGAIDHFTLEKLIAERDILLAESNRDGLKALQIALDIAEKELKIAQTKFNHGVISSEEVAKIKLARDTAAVRLKAEQVDASR